VATEEEKSYILICVCYLFLFRDPLQQVRSGQIKSGSMLC